MLTVLSQKAGRALRAGSINITTGIRAVGSFVSSGLSAAGACASRNSSALAFAFLFALAMIFAPTVAQAAVDAEITEMTTNAQSVFTTTKGIILSVVGFLILLGFVKLVKKR